MVGDHLALPVAGRKNLQDAEDAAGNHADLDEDAGVLGPLAGQQIERAHGGHDERAGNRRAAHVVRVLPSAPRD